ncbi:MAG TPA: sec-independent translocase [Arachnia sp.]|nr:sec-independent translocase [Arachnia sp.]
MFGIDAIDLVLILVLGVVMFGPERLPEYSRKAARVFIYLRGIANNAKSTLRTELGPDYSDLELRDLNPKTFIAKHMREEVAALDEARRELQAAEASLKQTTREVEKEAGSAVEAAQQPPPALPAPAVSSPFDPDAT